MPAVEQEQAGPVRTIALNRPEVLNAFDPPMLARPRARRGRGGRAPEVRAIVLTGGPRAFCTGEDLRAARPLDEAGFRAQIESCSVLATELRDAPKPVIAAVAGPAYGGGLELAVNCDVRIAAASARFACPETKWAPDDHQRLVAAAAPPRRRRLGARDRAARHGRRRRDGAAHRARDARRRRRGTRRRDAVGLAAGVAELDPDAVAATKRLLNADPAPWPAVLDAELDGRSSSGFARARGARAARRLRPEAVSGGVARRACSPSARARTPTARSCASAAGERTFAEADAEATALGRGLRAARRAPGGRVSSSLLPNCLDAAVLPFAVAARGAVHAPVNTAFRGRVLAHVARPHRGRACWSSTTRSPERSPRSRASSTHLRRVLVRGDAAAVARPPRALRRAPARRARAAARRRPPAARSPADLALLLFTSGTTGRSKGCMLSHRYALRQAELLIEHYELREDDVLYCPFPLFHLDALVLTVLPALVLGTTAAIGDALLRLGLLGRDPRVRRHRLRLHGRDADAAAQARRRGRTTATTRSGSRGACPCPTWAPSSRRASACGSSSCTARPTRASRSTSRSHEPRVPGSCGRAIDAVRGALVGDDGASVPDGEVGEIAVRPREPGCSPTATTACPRRPRRRRRDGWFLTGDLATRDADGNFFFVGRRKEAIRRRGENISAFEVEEVVLRPPGRAGRRRLRRAERAERGGGDGRGRRRARARRSTGGARRALRGGAWRATWCRATSTCSTRCRVTPTEKVEKYRLVERGVTATTWDREA